MAIMNVVERPLNAVQIVSRIDDAIDHASSDWEKYDETLDMAHLKLVSGKHPTVFLCNFELSAKDRASVQNAMLTGTDEDGKPKVGLGSWQLSVTRMVLKDIQNPDYVPEASRLVYKMDGNRHADDRTLNQLSRLGIVQEVFNHYIRHTEKAHIREAKN
jgi:hypothetical protein